MSGWPILSVVTFLPLVGAAFVLAIRGNDAVALRNMRWASLWTTIITFVLSLFIWINFDPADPGLLGRTTAGDGYAKHTYALTAKRDE